MSSWQLMLLIYAVFAAGIAVRLYRNGRRTFDHDFRAIDRQLVAAVSFYVSIPLVVGGQRGVKSVVANLLESYALLEDRPSKSVILHLAKTDFVDSMITLGAGPVACAALGLIVFFSAWWLPYNAAWNFFRFELGKHIITLALIAFPLGAAVLRGGDYWVLRQLITARVAWLGDLALLLVALVPIALWWLLRGKLRRRYVWLVTPVFDRWKRAKRRVDETPDDASARHELAGVYLSAHRPKRAMAALEAIGGDAADEPETSFLRGMAYLQLEMAREASEHLRSAGQKLQGSEHESSRPELLLEIMLALAGARLSLGDAEGALETAEEAEVMRPGDVRALILQADALSAAGKLEKARSRLLKALRRSSGMLTEQIERRMAKLNAER